MKPRLLLAVLLLVVLIISIGGYSIYVSYVIKPSRVPGPVVFSYSEDYWRGLYAFGFALSNSSIQENVEQFLVVVLFSLLWNIKSKWLWSGSQVKLWIRV